MSYPMWGIPIMGYSSPSHAQIRKFKRMYPGVTEAHNAMCEQVAEKKSEERREMLRIERDRVAACNHTVVSTGTDGVVCTKCRHFWALPYTGKPHWTESI